MTPDPRLVELIDTVQHELPDWTPPALPHGDAADLLDRLAGERLQDALTLLWPDGVSAQDVGLRLLVAIDVIEHESAVWTAIGAGHYQAEAWQREADRITKAIAREQR